MTAKKLRKALRSLVPSDGSTIGNGRLRQDLSETLGREVVGTAYDTARDARVAEGVLAKGQRPAGSVRFAEVDEGDLPEVVTPPSRESPEQEASAPTETPPKNGAKLATPRASASECAQVLGYRHADRRNSTQLLSSRLVPSRRGARPLCLSAGAIP
jgi:hypothetical protein